MLNNNKKIEKTTHLDYCLQPKELIKQTDEDLEACTAKVKRIKEDQQNHRVQRL